jgi:hypothetical protein
MPCRSALRLKTIEFYMPQRKEGCAVQLMHDELNQRACETKRTVTKTKL